MNKRIAITCGDINGIGPEIILKSLNYFLEKTKKKFVVIAPENVFKFYNENLKLNFRYQLVKKIEDITKSDERICVLNLGKANLKIGYPTKQSGQISYESILKSAELFKEGIIESVITAPISKYSFYLANINYPGHTELYADLTRTKNFAMTFLSKKIKCSIVTIHESLKNLTKKITKDKVKNHLNLIGSVAFNDLKLKNPRIAVLGLNPHAGEDGKIGSEEKDIIYPAILESEYVKNICGPFSSDGFFGKKAFLSFDFIVGMYHDQALIPFKLLNFNKGVNFTAGLPLIRTSPDHGTAFDIAGKFQADPNSFIEAIKYAILIYQNRMSDKVERKKN